jgi:hypothetical protein
MLPCRVHYAIKTCLWNACRPCACTLGTPHYSPSISSSLASSPTKASCQRIFPFNSAQIRRLFSSCSPYRCENKRCASGHLPLESAQRIGTIDTIPLIRVRPSRSNSHTCLDMASNRCRFGIQGQGYNCTTWVQVQVAHIHADTPTAADHKHCMLNKVLAFPEMALGFSRRQPLDIDQHGDFPTRHRCDSRQPSDLNFWTCNTKCTRDQRSHSRFLTRVSPHRLHCHDRRYFQQLNFGQPYMS